LFFSPLLPEGLHTLQRAAAVIGKRVQITLEDAHP
jgi:hypothetical protein